MEQVTFEKYVGDNTISKHQQLQLFALRPPKQLLKWIGNKQRYASQIADLIPEYNTYIEPFLGSGAILGTVAPASGIAADVLEPLIKIWQELQKNPQSLLKHYTDTWNKYIEDRSATYRRFRTASPKRTRISCRGFSLMKCSVIVCRLYVYRR